jgi:hypothetical protein
MYRNLPGKIPRKSLREIKTKGEIVKSFIKSNLPLKVFFLKILSYNIILI